MKDINTKICLQVKVPVIEVAMMWLPEVATRQIAVTLQFQSLDVYMFLALFWEGGRYSARVKVPSDECFFRLLLPISLDMMNGDGVSTAPMVVEGLR